MRKNGANDIGFPQDGLPGNHKQGDNSHIRWAFIIAGILILILIILIDAGVI